MLFLLIHRIYQFHLKPPLKSTIFPKATHPLHPQLPPGPTKDAPHIRSNHSLLDPSFKVATPQTQALHPSATSPDLRLLMRIAINQRGRILPSDPISRSIREIILKDFSNHPYLPRALPNKQCRQISPLRK